MPFDRSLYGGDEPSNREPTPEREDDHNQEEGKTAVINSDICEGLKPGDTLNLRIVESREGEYVVEYEKESEPEKGGDQQPEMASMAEGDGGDDMYS